MNNKLLIVFAFLFVMTLLGSILLEPFYYTSVTLSDLKAINEDVAEETDFFESDYKITPQKFYNYTKNSSIGKLNPDGTIFYYEK